MTSTINRPLPDGSQPVARGKTKRIQIRDGRPHACLITTGDWVTAGDGAKRKSRHGLGELRTTVTCNVFALLRRHGIPVAFYERWSETTFVAPHCKMIPLEVVVRFVAAGSYLKRNPETEAGTVFAEPVLEFFLKTTEKKFDGTALPVDDPLLRFTEENSFERAKLYLPNRPESEGQIEDVEIRRAQIVQGGFISEVVAIASIQALAPRAALVLRDAWAALDATLWDVKFEFGIGPNGHLYLADVVDPDSWRLVNKRNGQHLDKQPFRDSKSIVDLVGLYAIAAYLSNQFSF